MQYVRSFSGSVSKTWNSINPATLSGAIDVVVVEQEDGSLACSPFHVRFGKFSLLRPYEKKVEFKVNNVKQNYAMKLGEGGEAFFVFETSDDIPEGLQTSPLISPTTSPHGLSAQNIASSTSLQEPEFLDLDTDTAKKRPSNAVLQQVGDSTLSPDLKSQSDLGNITPISVSPPQNEMRPASGDWALPKLTPRAALERSASAEILAIGSPNQMLSFAESRQEFPWRASEPAGVPNSTERSSSPPPVSNDEAINRAISMSKKFSGSNIPTHVTETGDLMLDITGYKSSDEASLRADSIARKILAEEVEGNFDTGALIGADENGNLWIYSSEEAKEAAARKASLLTQASEAIISDAASDPGYHSDEERNRISPPLSEKHQRRPSDLPRSDMHPPGLVTPPKTPPDMTTAGDPNRNYAKTLRLTSAQLKALQLKPGPNSMSFSVNRATCQAYMHYWKYNIPVVISDIDGTITKSDALGHVLNMIGRDWTHPGVAKLYTDIAANGYNLLYLTSRSVGQADTTRAYLHGISQDGYKLPKGPVILSPDRTIAALRREVYLRKPEVFKMACLRDILNLFSPQPNPFYAGFGNRLTDALSYRSVNIPSTRIFTINSNGEVLLDLLTLNKYKNSYVTMREVVDHFFPPISLLVIGGGEEYTDFNYWRETPLDVDDFSASESDDRESYDHNRASRSLRSEDEGSDGDEDEDPENEMGDSYMSRESMDEPGNLVDSILESIEDDELEQSLTLEDEEVVEETEEEIEEDGTRVVLARDEDMPY